MQRNNSFRRSHGTGGFLNRPKSNFQARRQPSGRGKSRFSEKIDYNKFIQDNTETAPVAPPVSHQFSDFALNDFIQNNLKKKNYVTPTPIQDEVIEPILEGRDLIGLANTGTGKTAAFLLPMIEKVYRNRKEKVLIVAPTRELALQIEQELRTFSWDMRIFSTACVGGVPIHKQINSLRRQPNFVIGTPGRLKDLNQRGQIFFNTFTNIVLDEVDRMMDMGFVDEITEILNTLPENRQSLFFSATMPTKIGNLVNKFMKDPLTITVKTGDTASNVKQDIVRSDGSREDKLLKLRGMLAKSDFSKVLIFSETRRDVDRLSSDLSVSGFQALALHGDKKQREREKVLKLFNSNQISILVATDVAARGLDIQGITHVINYTVPQTYDDYIHRIGRTGRGTERGMALTFVS